MGLHSDTDIYATCIELLGDALAIVLNMRRAVKFPLGKLFIDGCTDLNTCLRRANMERGDKTPHIETLLERVEEVEFLTRMCRDRKHIDLNAYARIIGHTQSIRMQSSGWKTAEAAKRIQQPGLFPEPSR